ncbi:MAG: hypothetical protein M1418_06555 [Deltaproteobacteria bacterium]|nr:hypothetical protein [Deltaproteobacteria bacterium]
MTTYKLTIRLQEPTTFGAQRMIGNQAPSFDYIPATALRGALAGALAREGRSARLAPLFGGVSPRWSPAWPIGENGNELVVPMPLSYLHAKGDDGFEGILGVVNVLRTERPADAATYRELFGATSPSDVPAHLQWVCMAPGWLKCTISRKGEEIFSPGITMPKVGNAMFHGSDYLIGTARDSWLFSREAVAEFQTFVAYVVDEGDVIQKEDQLTEIYLGKRITAGNGAAVLAWEATPQDLPPWATQASPETDEAAVQVMTPAIVPAAQGGFLAGLDERAWSAILDAEVAVIKAQSAAESIHGWISAWDLPRERYAAVAAGSCYLLRLKDATRKTTFNTSLTRLAVKGVGIRTGEGFGWIAVSPPWLNATRFRGTPPAGGRFKSEQLRSPMNGIPLPKQRKLVEAALALVPADEEAKAMRKKAAEMVAIGNRVADVQEFKDYLSNLATRKNPRTWDVILKTYLASLTDEKLRTWEDVFPVWKENKRNHIAEENIDVLRYFLSWIKTFAARENE